MISIRRSPQSIARVLAFFLALSCKACGGGPPHTPNMSDSGAAPEVTRVAPSLDAKGIETSANEIQKQNCDDGTCFACGTGICPMGAHCDEDSAGGPACAWLPECKGKSSCTCVIKIVGDSCSCHEEAGGPTIHCE